MTEQKTKRSRSLAFVLAAGFLALSLTALIIAYIPQAILFLQTDFNRIDAEQSAIANDAANQVANFVQENFSGLELSANLVVPGDNSREEQESVLSHLLAEQPSLRSVILLDTNGREIAQSTRLAQAEVDSLLQQVDAAQQAVLDGNARYISPVYINETTSEPLITIAVPVQNILGDLKGIMLAEVNLKFLWDLVGDIQVGETGSAFVVNTNGDLLAHRDISRVLAGENLSQMEVVDQFMRGDVASGGSVFNNNENFGGTQGIATLVNIGLPTWAVVTFLPTAEGIQGLLINFAISLGIVLVLVGLTALVGVLLARRLSKPLVNLTNTATQISEGDVNLRAEVQGPTEVISLAEAFNTMTTQLQNLIDSLEVQVERRTRALETSTEVSRRLSTILDQDQLVREVVEQLRSAFGYYHAQIYLYDENQQELVMAGGTGDAGRAMLARGHKIRKGRGLVGRAAENNEIVLIPDVSQAEGWLPNPLLPDTKAEVAVPIAIGDEVVGVLDVQHNLQNGLSEEDASLIQAIANQVGVAVLNAQAYQQAQRQATRETKILSINQRIQSAGTIEEVLRIAVSELGQTLEANRSDVELSMTRKSNSDNRTI